MENVRLENLPFLDYFDDLTLPLSSSPMIQ